MNRQTFNGWAEAALAANEPTALALLAQNLAERQLTMRSKRGHRRAPAAPQLREEFRAVMVAAVVDCASKWTPAAGEFDSVIGRAVRSAFDGHARAGGYSLQVTWRGAYSTDKRAFSSQVDAKHKKTAGGAALEPERLNSEALSGYTLPRLVPDQTYHKSVFAELASARAAGVTQEQVNAYIRAQMRRDGFKV